MIPRNHQIQAKNDGIFGIILMEINLMNTNNGKRNILVVDDNEAQLENAKLLLEGDFNVATADSGKEALDYLIKGYLPDLILLDILMPNMDGWETYNRLRAISFLQEVPIIFITSLDGSSEKKHAFDIGAADFLTKPLVKSELVEKINKVLKAPVKPA